MDQNTEEKKSFVGFLALNESPNHDGFLGAILVTDIYGVPQEFRCTHPVKPTVIQKQLYGNTLVPHIGVNLCGIPLVGSIGSKPSVIIVDKPFLLDVRPKCVYPVIYVRRAGDAIDVRTSPEASGIESQPSRERVDCPTGKYQPVVFEPHHEFDDDRTSAKIVLENMFRLLDPLEPFQRIAKALEILGKQDTRFQ